MTVNEGRRSDFLVALRALTPSTENEAVAIAGLLDLLETDCDGPTLVAAKVELRDALILGSWQSPILGDPDGSGTLQGDNYRSRYERETIDLSHIEGELGSDESKVMLFRNADLAVDAVESLKRAELRLRDGWRHISLTPPNIRVGKFDALDSEMGALWWERTIHVKTTEDIGWLRLNDFRRLWSAPTLAQAYSAYLELEVLPPTMWTKGGARSKQGTPRPYRMAALASLQPDSRRCADAVLAVHEEYLGDLAEFQIQLRASGMASFGSVLHSPVGSDPKTVVAIGQSAYFENQRAVERVVDPARLVVFDEYQPLDALHGHENSQLLVLVEPVSNNAATHYVGPFTSWRSSRSYDLAVSNVVDLIEQLGQTATRQVTVAIDASMSGPGLWLAPVATRAREVGVSIVVWSSLQKHFMQGEDWCSGGFTIASADFEWGSAGGQKRFNDGIHSGALRAITLAAGNSAVRASRIGDAAATVGCELAQSCDGVVHPALPNHRGHLRWIDAGRPAVPFVFLRLGSSRSRSVRNMVLNEVGSGASKLFRERDSFGFDGPTLSDLFPGQPDEILRVSPGDPLVTGTGDVIGALRSAVLATSA